MLRIAILDDDPRIGIQLKNELKTIDNTIKADHFTSWKGLKLYLCSHPQVDAVIMDLHYENLTHDGIYYAEESVKLHPELKVIYITGYPLEYVQRIFFSRSIQPAGFIVKPFQRDVLKKHIAQLSCESPKEERLPFRSAHSTMEYIPMNEILWLSSSKRLVTVYTTGGSYTGYYKLSELASLLPAYFYQCHKSYIVNIRYIQRIEARQLIIQEQEIPISAIGKTTVAEKRMEIIRIKSRLHEQEVNL